jgi:hypothetical protein
MSEAIKLTYPIRGAGWPDVTEVTLRRPRTKDLIAMTQAIKSEGEVAGMAAFIASVTGIPLTAVMEMDAEDFKAVSEAAEGFLGQT